jgi:hypothetical protein
VSIGEIAASRVSDIVLATRLVQRIDTSITAL